MSKRKRPTMNEMDLYYRALRGYRKTVTPEKTHMRFLQALAKASAHEDRLESVRTKCIIDEKWVITIEELLPFVEKAIREDRQFIRQEGETVPIEKAKKVSKASVSHLARHSELITHVPEEDGDLLPDKIYITENESNYAIYENRFLYMLLCYARDFVEVRYTKISELGNTYTGNLRIKKHVEMGKRTINFSLKLDEVAKNDPRLSVDRATHDIIERLEAIRVQISALLLTPLMNEVSKAPMLRPPITRTNVLRMNNNFKNAVALYDYLSSYEGAGYTIEEIKKTFAPFPDQMGAELFESIPLLTHLLYKYGNGIEDELRAAYEKSEAEAAALEAEKKRKELEALRGRIHESAATMEEYLLRAEDHMKTLNKTLARLQEDAKKLESNLERVSAELDWQKDLEKQLRQNIETLEKGNDALNEQIDSERAAHEKAMQEAHEESERIATELKADCARQLTEARQAQKAQLEALRSEHDEIKQDLENKLLVLRQNIARSEEEQLALSARLHAYQLQCGEHTVTDLTDKSNFAQLEKEREWFERLFKETWAQTKKKIRLSLLWKKGSPSLPEKVEETPATDTDATQDDC